MDSLVVLFGKPASLKSFLARDWSLHVASGTDWLGRKVKGGAVVYVTGEGKGSLKRRVKAYMLSQTGFPEDPPFICVPEPVNVFTGAGVEALIHQAKEAFPGQPIRLVVFDTLHRCAEGADENSAQDMGTVVRNLDHIRNELGGPTVVVVHHTNSEGVRVRGSTSLEGAADTLIMQTWKGDHVVLQCKKQKDGEHFSDVRLIAKEVLVGEEDEDGQPIASLGPLTAFHGDIREPLGVSGLDAHVQRALDALPEGTGLTRTQWEKAIGLPKTTFKRVADELIGAGLVVRPARGGQYTRKAAPKAAA